MKNPCLYLLLFAILFMTMNRKGIAMNSALVPADPPAIEGRWDITFEINGNKRPGWLEIEKSGNSTLVGRIVVISGSARPISEVYLTKGKIIFTIPPQWEKGNDLSFEAILVEDKLMGTMHYSDGKSYPWTGVRSPVLRRNEPVWGEPEQLFNGKDLLGWYHSGSEKQWKVENGLLINPKSGSNLITEAKFNDFKLHLEFRYPKGSNSGIYLRGRYEVQIEDNKGRQPNSHLFGGIYGILTPNEMVAKDPGEWQSFDITLVGRMITVIANGTTIICNQEIPGITGGALDSHEGEPGPIYIQGDHGPIEFRSFVLTPGE